MPNNTIKSIVKAHVQHLRTERRDILESYKASRPDFAFTEEDLAGDLEEAGLSGRDVYLEALRATMQELRADGVTAVPDSLR